MMRKTKSTLLQCAALVSLLSSVIAVCLLVFCTAAEENKELTVSPATLLSAVKEIDLSSVTWDYGGSFIYDGKPHTVSLIGVPDNIEVAYQNNSFTEEGNYLASYELIYDKSSVRLVGIAPSYLEWRIVSAPPNVGKGDNGGFISAPEKTPPRSEAVVIDNTRYALLDIVGQVACVISVLTVSLILLLSVLLLSLVRKDKGVSHRARRTEVRYVTSFMARLIQSPEDVQILYGKIKNLILSYIGIRSKICWGHESYTKSKRLLAKINIKGKHVLLYLSLDPKKLEGSKYRFYDLSANHKFETTPLMLRLKSSRSLKHAEGLIALLMKDAGTTMSEIKSVDYRLPYETSAELYKKGIVKIRKSGIPPSPSERNFASGKRTSADREEVLC